MIRLANPNPRAACYNLGSDLAFSHSYSARSFIYHDIVKAIRSNYRKYIMIFTLDNCDNLDDGVFIPEENEKITLLKKCYPTIPCVFVSINAKLHPLGIGRFSQSDRDYIIYGAMRTIGKLLCDNTFSMAYRIYYDNYYRIECNIISSGIRYQILRS